MCLVVKYKCSPFPGNPRLQSDLLRDEWDVKILLTHSLTHSRLSYCALDHLARENGCRVPGRRGLQINTSLLWRAHGSGNKGALWACASRAMQYVLLHNDAFCQRAPVYAWPSRPASSIIISKFCIPYCNEAGEVAYKIGNCTQ